MNQLFCARSSATAYILYVLKRYNIGMSEGLKLHYLDSMCKDTEREVPAALDSMSTDSERTRTFAALDSTDSERHLLLLPRCYFTGPKKVSISRAQPLRLALVIYLCTHQKHYIRGRINHRSIIANTWQDSFILLYLLRPCREGSILYSRYLLAIPVYM